MRVDGYPHAPPSLFPGMRPSTYFIGGWVGPRAGQDGCGKFHPHRDSITELTVNTPVYSGASPCCHELVIKNKNSMYRHTWRHGNSKFKTQQCGLSVKRSSNDKNHQKYLWYLCDVTSYGTLRYFVSAIVSETVKEIYQRDEANESTLTNSVGVTTWSEAQTDTSSPGQPYQTNRFCPRNIQTCNTLQWKHGF